MAITARSTPSGGLSIHVEVLGEKQISRKMLRFAERAGSMVPVFEVIHDYLREVSDRQFQSQGQYSGKPWAKLRDTTIERKRRSKDPTTRANADRILHAQEKLRRSLVNAGDPNQKKVITPNTMVYGTKLVYAPFHMKPGPHSRPVRRPVDLTEKNKVAILKTLQMWIARGQAKLMGSI